MGLMTPEQFEESLKALHPRVFMNGKRVESVLENPNTRTVVEANKASYRWALDPRFQETMTCMSPLVEERVNRYTFVSSSVEDLLAKAKAGTFTSEHLGTCIYRCVGYDAFHALASTTWEMDRDLGTRYYPKFIEYLKMVQKSDLSVAGVLDRAPRQPCQEADRLARSVSLAQGCGETRRRGRGSRREDQQSAGHLRVTNWWSCPNRPTPSRRPTTLLRSQFQRMRRASHISASTALTRPSAKWPTTSTSLATRSSGSGRPHWWYSITSSCHGNGSSFAGRPSIRARSWPGSLERTV